MSARKQSLQGKHMLAWKGTGVSMNGWGAVVSSGTGGCVNLVNDLIIYFVLANAQLTL